jgi:hypothetical protein
MIPEMSVIFNQLMQLIDWEDLSTEIIDLGWLKWNDKWQKTVN